MSFKKGIGPVPFGHLLQVASCEGLGFRVAGPKIRISGTFRVMKVGVKFKVLGINLNHFRASQFRLRSGMHWRMLGEFLFTILEFWP